MENSYQRGRWVLGFLAIVAILIWTTVFSRPDQNLHIWFFDVGQGDAILIRTPRNQKILIDGGPDSKILTHLGKILPFYDKKIDLVVSSHNHSDHLKGLIQVIDRYKVEEIWVSGAIHTTDTFLEWLKKIGEKKIPLKIVWAPNSKNFFLLKLEVFHPLSNFEGIRPEDQHQANVALKITYDKIGVLLTGDLNEQLESKILASGFDLRSQILKVPHQGSEDSLLKEFLERIKPEIAIILVGEKNKFGHPRVEIIEKLEKIGSKIYRTDKNGTIEVISDGKNYWTKTER